MESEIKMRALTEVSICGARRFGHVSRAWIAVVLREVLAEDLSTLDSCKPRRGCVGKANLGIVVYHQMVDKVPMFMT
jgi:hypothetical protein